MSGASKTSKAQRGAALLTVLLLVATLSFVVLSISQRTVLAARRTLNANAQSELLWRAFGVEAMAIGALERAMSGENGVVAVDNPILLGPIDLPIEDGAARLHFSDRTDCFNLNGLVSDTGDKNFALAEAAANEFSMVLDSLGFGAGEAEALTAVVIDWIDADSLQGVRGAEDGFYTGLPTPFRTGGALLADKSELRAMKGVTPEIYKQLAPFICAHPKAALIEINVNTLGVEDAPVLVGLLDGRLSLREAADIISRRPPVGFSDISEFWALVEIPEFTPSKEQTSRTVLTSAYYEARVELTYASSTMEMLLAFENSNGQIKLISRRIGSGQ